MSIVRILHVVKPGHRCTHPYDRGLISELKQGASMSFAHWTMEYYPTIKAYGVHPRNRPQPFYEFTNFNCAAAKLHELGKAAPQLEMV